MTAVAETKRLHPYWHGMLCAETREDIAQRMRNVLEGQRFTYVHCNSYAEDEWRFSAVDINTTQRLTRPVEDDTGGDGYTSVWWSITDYSMGVHTKATTQAEGRDGAPYDYVSFNFTQRRITIDHFAPARYKLRWEFVLEDHIDDRLLETEVLLAFARGKDEAEAQALPGNLLRHGMAAAIKEARYE